MNEEWNQVSKGRNPKQKPKNKGTAKVQKNNSNSSISNNDKIVDGNKYKPTQKRPKATGKTRIVEPVMLGYSDGDICEEEDSDPFVSKLGGTPLWLDRISAIPDHKSMSCKSCGSEMILLVQAYVPLNDSPYDRVLYIWACNRRSCSGKPGSTKAIRGHLLNKEYTRKLLKKQRPARGYGGGKSCNNQKQHQRPQFDFGSVWGSNGSSLSKANDSSTLFSGPLFGNPDSNSEGTGLFSQKTSDKRSDINPAISPVTETLQNPGEIQLNMESLEINDNDKQIRNEWPQTQTPIPGQYLAIDEEILEETQIAKRYEAEIMQAKYMLEGSATGSATANPKGKENGNLQETRNKSQSDSGYNEEWSGEQYENTILPKGTDATFESFIDIVSQNPEQVVRHQFGGVPLFYTMQDDTASLLNPPVSTHNGNSQRNKSSSADGDEDAEYDNQEDSDDDSTLLRRYTVDRLPPCPRCGGKRIFEFQLMPAMLSILPLSQYVSRVPIVDEVSGSETGGKSQQLVGSHFMHSLDLGMEFGTMMVFVCENDCHNGKIGLQYLADDETSMNRYAHAEYYEELILVQLEAHLDLKMDSTSIS